jgi:hypothetical protein
MNLPPTTATPTNTTAETRAPDGARDATPRDTQQQRDAFERSLRSKALQFDEGDADEAKPEGGAGFFPGATPALHSRPQPAGPVPAAVETASTGARAAIEAALTHSAPIVSPVAGTDPAAVWEASVRGADSIPLDVRVVRAEKAPGEMQAGLTMTIGSSGVNTDVLVRHAPRLNERLRKHGVEFEHVRIQRDEGDA